MAKIWIGTSGYVYPAWRGRFYPAGMPASQELAFASRSFSSIEINRSFYALLSPAACRAWRAAVPPDFVFALKGSRFITHNKKLRDAHQALANFFAAGPLLLGAMLGPIVWQLPASARFDEARLREFLALLPRTAGEAAALARQHDARLRRGSHTEVDDAQRMLRHVLEPRHESFLSASCVALLRAHNVALAITDSPEWPHAEEPTADFMYLRLHGSQRLYASQYSEQELQRWAERARTFCAGGVPADARRASDLPIPRRARDVYVYFDNDFQAYAPQDALRLQALLSRKAPAARGRRVTARPTRPAAARAGAKSAARHAS